MHLTQVEPTGNRAVGPLSSSGVDHSRTSSKLQRKSSSLFQKLPSRQYREQAFTHVTVTAHTFGMTLERMEKNKRIGRTT